MKIKKIEEVKQELEPLGLSQEEMLTLLEEKANSVLSGTPIAVFPGEGVESLSLTRSWLRTASQVGFLTLEHVSSLPSTSIEMKWVVDASYTEATEKNQEILRKMLETGDVIAVIHRDYQQEWKHSKMYQEQEPVMVTLKNAVHNLKNTDVKKVRSSVCSI